MMLDQACLIFESCSGRCQPEKDLVIIQKILLSDYDLEICFLNPEIQAADLARSAIADGFKTIFSPGGGDRNSVFFQGVETIRPES